MIDPEPTPCEACRQAVGFPHYHCCRCGLPAATPATHWNADSGHWICPTGVSVSDEKEFKPEKLHTTITVSEGITTFEDGTSIEASVDDIRRIPETLKAIKDLDRVLESQYQELKTLDENIKDLTTRLESREKEITALKDKLDREIEMREEAAIGCSSWYESFKNQRLRRLNAMIEVDALKKRLLELETPNGAAG